MATKAQQIMRDEPTANGLEAMDEARYRAFLQEGLDELDRGEGIGEAEMDLFFEKLLADLAI